jgi:hypothetical protein
LLAAAVLPPFSTTMRDIGCVLLLLLLFDIVTASNDGVALSTKVQLAVVIALIANLDSVDDEVVVVPKSRSPREKARYRVRRSVRSIFEAYGPYYVRRAYRMTEASFWELHALLKPLMGSTRRRAGGRHKKHRNGGTNGLISSEIRLSAAIRYFAGGRPDDIAISHGIAHSEVFVSCWKVVDAVNNCRELEFFSLHVTRSKRRMRLPLRSAASVDLTAVLLQLMAC